MKIQPIIQGLQFPMFNPDSGIWLVKDIIHQELKFSVVNPRFRSVGINTEIWHPLKPVVFVWHYTCLNRKYSRMENSEISWSTEKNHITILNLGWPLKMCLWLYKYPSQVQGNCTNCISFGRAARPLNERIINALCASLRIRYLPWTERNGVGS